MMRLPRSVWALVLGGALGLTGLLHSEPAEAGRGRGGVRFSGQVRVRGNAGVSVRFARPYVRPWHRYRWFGGRVWVGGYYYPRPYYYYYPEYVPSYYGPSYHGSYYPVEAPPTGAPGLVAAAPLPVVKPAPPTFGIGVFAGGSGFRDSESFRDEQDSSDLGVLGRVRLTPGLMIEGELGQTRFRDNLRVDRRIGGSLIWELGARNTFAPYLLGGIGVNQAEVDDSFTTTQNFVEIGLGLRIALSRHLHIAGDVRGGTRRAVDSDDRPVALSAEARSFAPPVDGNDEEDYWRARLAAIVNF